jgi:hypothetical protein
MDFSFFLIDNKSGYKTREKWLSKNHPDLYKQIIDYSSSFDLNLSFKEKIWFFFQKIKERPKCVTCSNELKFRERFDNPYGEFCSLNCINSNDEEMKKRQTKTFIEKYNVEYYPKHTDFIKKQKKTKLEKYGNENFNNIEKVKKTKENKYGNENFNNIEKQKQTCIIKYNSENYSTSNNYKNLIKENYRKLYPNLNFLDIEKEFVTLKCDECGVISKVSKQLVYERSKRNYNTCLTCNPIGNQQRSGYEFEVCEFLK